MQRTTLALLCSATVGVTFAASQRLFAPAHASESTSRPTPEVGTALSLQPEAALSHEIATLRERLASLELGVASLGGAERGRTDVGALEQLVRDAVAAALVEARGVSSESTPEAKPRRALAAVVDDVLAANDVERAELWRQLAAEGRADEVLEALRLRAEAAPGDPEKQLELGQAYIARIAEVGSSPLAGKYALAADQAFDRALTADPEHHSARFHKAVALSFWPPVFGKQGAAIAQFEQLVTQQARLAARPSFAETHLLLGNLYEQTGQRDKAIAAWQQGANLYPEHTGLNQQLALLQQQE
jgi:tetratricopeptide (TPR) repeat protein